MDTVYDTLKRKYDLFIGQEKVLPFCKGLASYLDYVLVTSPFKEVFKEEVQEYKKSNTKLTELEKKTRSENY